MAMVYVLILGGVVAALIIGLALFAYSPRAMDEEAAHEAALESEEELRRATQQPYVRLTQKELDEENEREVDAQR